MIEKFTLAEFAQMMQKKKWYLLLVEETIERTLHRGYGSVTLKLELRDGQVERVNVMNTEEVVLRPKEGFPKTVSFSAVTFDNLVSE